MVGRPRLFTLNVGGHGFLLMVGLEGVFTVRGKTPVDGRRCYSLSPLVLAISRIRSLHKNQPPTTSRIATPVTARVDGE